ncbi:SMI1/KNR4 family protein [Neisseria dumasiana]|uniref:SMI1/KNR4 family protein n=1 Tax=Neisseria dumasiana TaxID=1931275 RepID=UPI000A18BAD9|nr:SMI1/KNR4 family protein [Neisseria dumasiana]OSI14515.1 SMI1/KNR4 family protein [Neisseria dumasiana]
MNRRELENLYTLNSPATTLAIEMLPQEWLYLYSSYIEFLKISNGLFGNEITLLETEHIQQRNIDYEVKEYLPNYLMIGDNGGGVAILMDNKNQNIFAVDMGVMSEECLKKISPNLEDFLLVKKGMFDY